MKPRPLAILSKSQSSLTQISLLVSSTSRRSTTATRQAVARRL
ncbi:hypothetical protein RchiOBHm_Chr2g0137331 [Rosa chinensis]|uniref:Uncharacterized protein n=1 Tax=Rosa chinensis TaxID=74649 RepID=A0A2P6RWJ6_ROSCH|nr:hypothetical protein RchiOBHm_Chr2g0137331 [Rosa chinensis]